MADQDKWCLLEETNGLKRGSYSIDCCGGTDIYSHIFSRGGHRWAHDGRWRMIHVWRKGEGQRQPRDMKNHDTPRVSSHTEAISHFQLHRPKRYFVGTAHISVGSLDTSLNPVHANGVIKEKCFKNRYFKWCALKK